MAQIRAGRRETRHTHEVSSVRQCHEFAQEHGGGQMREEKRKGRSKGEFVSSAWPGCLRHIAARYL